MLTNDELIAARDWMLDCCRFAHEEDDVRELSEKAVEAFVARRYDGGLEAFKLSCIPS